MNLAPSRGARRLLLAAAVCLAAAPAGATSYVMLGDPALVADSALAVEARILSVDPAPGTRLPAQDYMIEVERVLAGEATGRNLVVRVPGGRSASGIVWQVDGVPRFGVGERVLLFLHPLPEGTWGVRHLMLGAFHEVVADGERLFVRDLSEARELGAQSQERARYRQARKAEAFSRWVSDRGRGIEREPDYFVEETEAGVMSSVTAAFRLFGNDGTGLNLRWFDFDQGPDLSCGSYTIQRDRPVDFLIVEGGQPGFNQNATANALRTAIDAWNRVSGTNIRYRYGGTTPTSEGFEDCPEVRQNPDTVCLDGKNAILYDNADGSIESGAFNCLQGGGTLAIGGPIYDDGCRLPGPQNRDFHPSVEAEIITNAGIECVVQTQRDLEQLFAHELGHTLGIHHTCQEHPCGTALDQDALMYPIFHGDQRGAQLNSDDMAAARHLYPGASVPVPAAPSGLAAGPLSPTSVELSWVDNSTDETSFRVEARPAGGTFATVGNPAANATSFVVTGLLPDTTYTFRVRARNAAGLSGFSEVIITTAPAVPAAPANLVAAPDSASAVGLTWDDLSSNETGFRIELRSPLTGDWVEVGLVPAEAESTSVPGLVADRPYTFRMIAVNGSGESAPSNSASATPHAADVACENTDTTVCLLDRFRVTIQWNNPHLAGGNGVGHTAPFPGSDRTATAWFFSPDNIELIVKVLDGSSINDFFWVFHGQLTDVEFWVSVVDTETGFSTTYHNPPLDRCGEFDTAALPAEGIPFEESTFAPGPLTAPAAPAIDPDTGACVPDAETLCLLGGRFAVQVDFVDQHNGGVPGVGKTLPAATTDRTGYFWFFNPVNVELVVKVLQAQDTFWVFYGSLSDVQYTLTVTDTETGRTKTYHNAPGHRCGQFDTGAFPPES